MRILLLLLSWILGYFLAGSLREIQRGLQAFIYKSSVPFFGELGHPLQDNRYNSVIQVLSDWHCFQFLCDGDRYFIGWHCDYSVANLLCVCDILKGIIWVWESWQKIISSGVFAFRRNLLTRSGEASSLSCWLILGNRVRDDSIATLESCVILSEVDHVLKLGSCFSFLWNIVLDRQFWSPVAKMLFSWGRDLLVDSVVAHKAPHRDAW